MVHSRRTFLSSSTQILGAGWLTTNWPAIADAAAHAAAAHTAAGQAAAPHQTFTTLTPEQARDLDAMTAQIIPTDDTPGAREAGAVTFIDRALATFYAVHRTDFQADYAAFAKQQSVRFADLPIPRQIETLQLIESSRLFGAVRFLTVLGFLASPSYGGNRNGIGWQVIGFKDDHHFSPPFGYYDRDYAGFVPYDERKPA